MQKNREVIIETSDKQKFFDVDDDIATNLRFSEVSIYSTTPTDQAKYTAELLLNYYTRDVLATKTLTDATACIGGNSWIFADYVKKVIANELDPLNFEILNHNMNALERKNVECINDDYLKIYDSLSQDIIFFDPPWGGVDYKSASQISLTLGDQLIDQLINYKLAYYCETLILKLPFNYEFKKITDYSPFREHENIVIKAKDGKPLYRLIVLSHLQHSLHPPKKKDEPPVFNRLGYKSMNIKYKSVKV